MGEEKKKKILIIDNSDTLLRTLSSQLSKDYQVLTATQGKVGIGLLGKESVDLLILDLMLPDLPGQNILLALQKGKVSLPSIVLTASKSKQAFQAAMQAGARKIILKPYQYAVLKKEIDFILAYEPYSAEREKKLTQVLAEFEKELKSEN